MVTCRTALADDSGAADTESSPSDKGKGKGDKGSEDDPDSAPASAPQRITDGVARRSLAQCNTVPCTCWLCSRIR
jgi:hypothetical protein